MIALYIYAFYAGFALSICVYRQWQKGTLNLLNKVAFAPVLIAFFLVDLIINWTVLFAVMGETPLGTKTISDRFEVYHKGDYGWKTKVATFFCEKLLSPIDPAGVHC